jgi:YfiH family protein
VRLPPADVVTRWRENDNGVPLLEWPAFDSLAVEIAVTTRAGGVSAGAYSSLNLGLHVGDDDALVVENRRLAAAAFGASLDDLVFANQVHGNAVVDVASRDRGRGTSSTAGAIDGVDAFVTGDAGVVLVMMVADCVPIGLYDPVQHVLAVVHSGWRGTEQRILNHTVEHMIARLGSHAADIVAAIGPSVSASTYQVGDEVAKKMEVSFGPAAAEFVTAGEGGYRIDLPRACRLSLREAGLKDDCIHATGLVTGEDGCFFSHRAVQPCGRFAMLARLRAK